MTSTIRLGISTCPNDTFAFHGLLHRRVDWQGLNFDTELLDVEELNRRLCIGDFDVAKASFYAALMLADSTVVLPSGSALGFGVGPLLLSRHPNVGPRNIEQPIILCPGPHTTATLLFRMFYPQIESIRHVVFSEIMPALQNKKADFGVCIHEGRFTWRESNLHLVEDLGERWESSTQLPLPLGGILAGRHLPEQTIAKVQNVIRTSIEYGLEHRQEAIPTMRRYAQEFSDEILMAHVDLYVNEHTIDFGTLGRQALEMLSARARSAGVLSDANSGVSVFEYCGQDP